jgi:hypothetical protein
MEGNHSVDLDQRASSCVRPVDVGHQYRAKINDGENPRVVAARLGRALRGNVAQG